MRVTAISDMSSVSQDGANPGTDRQLVIRNNSINVRPSRTAAVGSQLNSGPTLLLDALVVGVGPADERHREPIARMGPVYAEPACYAVGFKL